MGVLDGTTAIVTGANRGIGLGIARAFAREGASLVLAARDAELLNAVAVDLRELGSEVEVVPTDVTVEAAVDELIARTIDRFGHLDVLVNNAGITKDNIVLRMTEDEWMDVLNVNLNAAFKFSKIVLKFMLKKRWGRIINITSTSASTGNKGQANYAAAKAGVEAFSKSLAKEVGSRGITVNAIAPGYIQTDMTEVINEKVKEEILSQIPLARFGKPEEISQLVDFLISDEASYITGQTIHVNGGLFM